MFLAACSCRLVAAKIKMSLSKRHMKQIHHRSKGHRDVTPFAVKITGKPLTLRETVTKYGVSANQVAIIAKLLTKSDHYASTSDGKKVLATMAKMSRSRPVSRYRGKRVSSGKKSRVQ